MPASALASSASSACRTPAESRADRVERAALRAPSGAGIRLQQPVGRTRDAVRRDGDRRGAPRLERRGAVKARMAAVVAVDDCRGRGRRDCPSLPAPRPRALQHAAAPAVLGQRPREWRSRPGPPPTMIAVRVRTPGSTLPCGMRHGREAGANRARCRRVDCRCADSTTNPADVKPRVSVALQGAATSVASGAASRASARAPWIAPPSAAGEPLGRRTHPRPRSARAAAGAHRRGRAAVASGRRRTPGGGSCEVRGGHARATASRSDGACVEVSKRPVGIPG